MRLGLRLLDDVFIMMELMSLIGTLMRQMLMKQRLMLVGVNLLQLLRRGHQLTVLLLLLMLVLRRARLTVRSLLLNPAVYHWLNFVRVVVTGVGDDVIVVTAVVVSVVGVAVAVAATEIGERGGVYAVRARVVVGSVARIVPRLKTVKSRVAVVRTLIQNRGNRGDARPCAPLPVRLASYLDYHRCFAGSTEAYFICSIIVQNIAQLCSNRSPRDDIVPSKFNGTIASTNRRTISNFNNFTKLIAKEN